MSEALERLQKIGAQKIYEDTHIPVKYVQSIIHESFEGFTRVQFLGFISILERQYKEDLSQLREDGLKFFPDIYQDMDAESLFITPKKGKNLKFLYLFLALAIFIGVAYYQINTEDESSKIVEVDNTLIVDAQKHIGLSDENESEVVALDINASLEDLNATNEEKSVDIPPEEQAPKSLKFLSKSKVWIGYINIKTNRHFDRNFTGEFEIDASEGWLLVFGHSNVDIVLDGKVLEFDTEENLRFIYEDAEVRAISLKEFKKLNRGRAW